MKKVIRLTESDLVRLINRVISEQSTEGEIFTPEEIKINDQKRLTIRKMVDEIANMFEIFGPISKMTEYDIHQQASRVSSKITHEELKKILNNGKIKLDQIKSFIRKNSPIDVDTNLNTEIIRIEDALKTISKNISKFSNPKSTYSSKNSI